jgi:predicted nucleic acid-binding protein
MKKILLDANVIMAVILNEDNKDLIINITNGSQILSPNVISYEIGNAFSSLYKRHKLNHYEVLNSFDLFLKIPIETLDVDIKSALEISCKYNIYAYDAYYLELAQRLKLLLFTFDLQMAKITSDMNINILKK